MFHVEHLYKTIEFDKLLKIIAEFTKSDLSKKAVLSISPLKSIDEINKRLRLIEEIRLMSQKGNPLTIQPFPDIEPFLQKVKPEGSLLDSLELLGIKTFLSVDVSVLSQIRGFSELQLLNRLINRMTGQQKILDMLTRSIDNEGNILDSASFVLKEIREEIKNIESRIKKKLEEIVRDKKIAIFLQDEFITKRSGRWVIPVRMDSKGQVQGIVHDVSRSGETVFVEPYSIIGLSNDLENLVAEQKAEEIRILKSISSEIRGSVSDIYKEYKAIVYIDLLCSIAYFADKLKMESPKIEKKNYINLLNARHPLLMLAFKDKGMHQQVVPLNVTLGGGNTVMVITGPNAGGKTIAIKTLGLLIMMALCGMPIPADSSSSLPFISNLFVDIGDQQSIENSLSTFSAHMSNISEILKKADSKSIVLIDELGTGTEPEEGSAIACAVLKELKDKGVLAFATTHLTEIKGFVHKTEGMLNASMEFDSNTLKPLYKLRIGEPGRSHAFETAKRYGLPDEVIESAKAILGTGKKEIDSLIHDLNEKIKQYEERLKEINEKEKVINQKEKYLEEMIKNTEQMQRNILFNAYKDAQEVVFNVKRQMNIFLEAIKRDKEKARDIIKEVESVQAILAEKANEYRQNEKHRLPITEIKEGDTVFVEPLKHFAEVVKINIKNKYLRVRVGSMEIEVPFSDIGFKKDQITKVDTSNIHAENLNETISSEINLIGLRVEEALSRLESFLNHAFLAGVSEINIIHGIGTGTLSNAVRNYLTGHPLIKYFRKGKQNEGGDGVTVATLT